MGSPKHQHFIPRSYLKYFGKKEGDLYLVDTIMKGEGNDIQILPTKSICVQKNLYTFPLNTPGDRFALEKFYAVEVDAIYPEVYDMLVNPNITVISVDDKKKILNTVLSLFFRTPTFLNYRTDKLDAILDRIAAEVTDPDQEITVGLRNGNQIKFPKKDLEDIRQQQKAKIKEEFLISHFAEWQSFVDYKMQCELEVINVTDEVPIITSDNPVVIMDLNGQINLSDIFHHDNIIEVPIDRDTYLIVYPNSTAENARLRITRSKRDKYFTVGTNRSIEKNSDLRLIGYPGDLSIHFDSQKELGEWNAENVRAFDDLLKKTALAVELTAVIKKNKTSICSEVAEKVKEIRKTKMMDGDEMFNKLILALARNGYLTV